MALRNDLSTDSKDLPQQVTGTPHSRDTLQGFSLAPCKLLSRAHTRISMEFFGPAPRYSGPELQYSGFSMQVAAAQTN